MEYLKDCRGCFPCNWPLIHAFSHSEKLRDDYCGLLFFKPDVLEQGFLIWGVYNSDHPLYLDRKSFFYFLTKIKSTVMIIDFLPHRKAKQDPPTVVLAVCFHIPALKL